MANYINGSNRDSLRAQLEKARQNRQQEITRQEQQRRSDLLAQIAALQSSASQRPSSDQKLLSLNEALHLAENGKTSLPSDDSSFDQVIVRIKEAKRLEEQAVKQSNSLNEAQMLEREASELAGSLETEDIQNAITKFESAIQKYQEASRSDLAEKASLRKDWCWSALSNLSHVRERIMQVRQRLERLRISQKDSLASEKELSRGLMIACGLLSSIRHLHLENTDIVQLTDEAKELASLLHWSEQQFQKALNNPLSDSDGSDQPFGDEDNLQGEMAKITKGLTQVNDSIVESTTNITNGLNQSRKQAARHMIIALLILLSAFAGVVIWLQFLWNPALPDNSDQLAAIVQAQQTRMVQMQQSNTTEIALAVGDIQRSVSGSSQEIISAQQTQIASLEQAVVALSAELKSPPTPEVQITATSEANVTLSPTQVSYTPVIGTLEFNTNIWITNDATNPENVIKEANGLAKWLLANTTLDVYCKSKGKAQDGSELLFLYIWTREIAGKIDYGFVSNRKFQDQENLITNIISCEGNLPIPSSLVVSTPILNITGTLEISSSLWILPDASDRNNVYREANGQELILEEGTTVNIFCKVLGKDSEGRDLWFYYVWVKIQEQFVPGFIGQAKFTNASELEAGLVECGDSYPTPTPTP